MNDEKLLQYLKIFCKGRANTRKSEEIERAVCISGNELRKVVNRLRRKGIPIGSSRSGYFYAVTAGEVYSTIRQLMLIVLETHIPKQSSKLQRMTSRIFMMYVMI